MQEEERKTDEKKKERQYVFHQKFEEDLENYRKTGFLDGKNTLAGRSTY